MRKFHRRVLRLVTFWIYSALTLEFSTEITQLSGVRILVERKLISSTVPSNVPSTM